MPEKKKKICPILTALMPMEGGKKPAFSCLGDGCAWWVNLKDGENREFGMCAIPALISVRVI